MLKDFIVAQNDPDNIFDRFKHKKGNKEPSPNVFDTKSLQIGELPTGSSKYVPNRGIFEKHCILRNKIKP